MSQTNQHVGPDGSWGTAPPVGTRRPVGVVITSVLDGVRSLIRKEVELAKIEATEAVAARAMGAGLMGAAVVLGLFGLGFAAASATAALDIVLPAWASRLIVAGVFVLLAVGLLLAGRSAIRTAPTPQRTQETLKEDARWAKQQIAR